MTVRIHSVVLGSDDEPTPGQSPARPAVVALHGWGQTGASFRTLGDALAKSYRVHLLDLPGFGASDAPDGDWSTLEYTDRISRYLDENSLSPAILLGHSFGGRVCVRLAARHASQVAAMVLIGGAGLRPHRSARQRLRLAWIRLLGHLVRLLAPLVGEGLRERFRQRYASPDDQNAGALRGTFRKVIAEDLTHEARRIQAPSLLLWGDRDNATPLDMGQRYNALIAGSQLVVLPGQDHFPFIGAGAQQCAFHILGFLSQRLPPARETHARA